VIPYGRQSVDDDDIAAVTRTLKGDWLTGGPAVAEFERALADRVQADHAVTFANGTAALHAALAAAGIGPGDRVATSPLSFAASAACAVYVGATATYVDIDPDTLNLDPAQVPVEADALVAVHYAGLPVDLTRLGHRPRVVVEDAAQALGACTADGPVGNCARSDMTTFSFHPVKTITTGEGGAVTTNDDALAHRLRAFRNHGLGPGPADEPWATRIDTPGHNYRLTDVQAALGTSQLDKLDRFVERREVLAGRYDLALSEADLLLPPPASPPVRHARHLYPVRVEHRRAVYEALRAAGIGVQVHHVPIHHHPAYRFDTHRDALPETEAAYAHLLSLPLFPDLTEDEQLHVIDTLQTTLTEIR
jgi:dTDP-4-amino-4,6-dideoxygalactose transaminase